jgi:hypothetical protein
MLKKVLATMSLGLAISVNVWAQGGSNQAVYNGSSLPAATAGVDANITVDLHQFPDARVREDSSHAITIAAAPADFIQARAMDRASVGVLPEIPMVPGEPAPQMDLRKAQDSTKSVSLQYPACSMVKSYSIDNGWPGHALTKDDWKTADNINLHILATGCTIGHGTDLQQHPITYLTLVVKGQIYDMQAEAGNWFKAQIPMHVWASATHMELKQ